MMKRAMSALFVGGLLCGSVFSGTAVLAATEAGTRKIRLLGISVSNFG